MGNVRGQVLALQSEDPVLRWVGPIGLASAHGSALIIDLSRQVTPRTLADVRNDGPRLDELSPGRAGIATIAAGDLASGALEEVVSLLARSWPAVVVRSDGKRWDGATVPYRAAMPGALAERSDVPAVWQLASGRDAAGLDGYVMPGLGSGLIRTMLEGRIPRRNRWVRAWSKVWSIPWA